jgi:hypothetical protein
MHKADQVLGIRRLQRFCRAISRILYHIEPSLEGLNAHFRESRLGADITTLLISSATELETAWNVLRLANTAAARRQGRVACEFVAVAVLLAIPREELAKLPKKQAPISYALRQNPSMSVLDLYEANPANGSSSSRSGLFVPASRFFKSFLYVAEQILKMSSETIQGLGDYRDHVQHPASHGSSDVIWQHFEGFSARRKEAGAFLVGRRHPSIRFEGDQTINLAVLLADILDWTSYRYLQSKGDA